MCLGTPMKIIRIKGKTATVHSHGHKHKVDTALLENPKIGDWILAHGNLAIQTLDKKSANEIIKIQKEAHLA
ncbi:HypC/HybG/HupF family hydrogenase formation chaperone [Candidatus Berkelbacteria bacterium CG_4_9_14_3_um_filter_39_23]|uniref:HypC/HybG/HupF family hydrogenase formation chaperone n=2 Tax=Candidatus Berkelbacteria TaxID=1618330 RepID=A0A2M7CIB9_9BACT|nr:MAG: hypothetical protein AUK14_03090 [Candidatus Berkelbacteria bacterium CG2_30_39_44]PIR27731.1 MAG: HypC/HybG/HupF family hydrogenase formation chaperone [Candidatus Berkelbacteria bacterium CG11_big_fil_rev_8_21_14_0_20_40_23]PIV25392.1 MAG: HypC/HybG/HupF family hydrogenase formation chaperone [Candidatus Berkelbacteria bacterium CG03_land_8_20_14_0_80_40_36]PIX30832.1 MAG: HypC/HybG/HupF family hydrogenase formation chaperone [Candidatus Berkelbacteria bacterium CG_4_8_14_3_um_filter_3